MSVQTSSEAGVHGGVRCHRGRRPRPLPRPAPARARRRGAHVQSALRAIGHEGIAVHSHAFARRDHAMPPRLTMAPGRAPGASRHAACARPSVAVPAAAAVSRPPAALPGSPAARIATVPSNAAPSNLLRSRRGAKGGRPAAEGDAMRAPYPRPPREAYWSAVLVGGQARPLPSGGHASHRFPRPSAGAGLRG